MIQQALEFLSKLQTPKNPVTVTVHGQPFAVKPDGTLGEAVHPVDVDFNLPPLVLSTLSGIVDAYKAKVNELGSRVALQVESHLKVRLVDLDLDACGRRRVYAVAGHEPDTAFEFGRFYEPEKFLIAFRAGFYFNDEAVKVTNAKKLNANFTGLIL